MPIAIDGSRVPAKLERMACGGVPFLTWTVDVPTGEL